MLNTIPLKDPLGHTIHIPKGIFKKCCRGYKEIKRVITAPAFLIQEREKKMYFIRLVDRNVNILVEVSCEDDSFTVLSCMQNPTPSYISTLLKKGSLISFV